MGMREGRVASEERNSREARKPHAPCCPVLPGTFQMLYQSRDGRLCLFESKEGHLSAVDASKLVQACGDAPCVRDCPSSSAGHAVSSVDDMG